eukprot:6831209-Lingulodinium_polyedra.AAC.1
MAASSWSSFGNRPLKGCNSTGHTARGTCVASRNIHASAGVGSWNAAPNALVRTRAASQRATASSMDSPPRRRNDMSSTMATVELSKPRAPNLRSRPAI